jgi:outer membrane protein TolC
MVACALGALVSGIVAGCASPLDGPGRVSDRPVVAGPDGLAPASRFREAETGGGAAPALDPGAAAEDFVRYALFNSPAVEAAYQRWRAAAERGPQVGALPDPRLNVGFFLDEVETRVGPQQARVGVSQTLPWPAKLGDRADAADRAALAAWWRFEAARLEVTERVVTALHELAYLDAALRIGRENLDLLASFEEVVRARYRVGAGSHPELIRVQVELGQVQDRLAQLEAMRPAYVAELNAALNRPSGAAVGPVAALPGRVAAIDAEALGEVALRESPMLLAMDERVAEQGLLSEAARKERIPDLTVGLDYIATADGPNAAMPERGHDPVMLSFGINVPLWREKYDAGVRESVARRLAAAHDREDEANRILAAVGRAYFEHTDADRRVRLYERTLIPKAEESLRASLAGFRTGETSFLDLLDTERTLLEFAVAGERARADRGEALARLETLVGGRVPTREEGTPDGEEERP